MDFLQNHRPPLRIQLKLSLWDRLMLKLNQSHTPVMPRRTIYDRLWLLVTVIICGLSIYFFGAPG